MRDGALRRHHARPLFERVRQPVLLFDALGLALFAVTGTEKALEHGMLRDLLVVRLPIVLHNDIYAVAALAGGAIVALGVWLHVPSAAALSAGALVCVALRLLAIYRHWSLPGAWNKPSCFQSWHFLASRQTCCATRRCRCFLGARKEK